MTAFVKLASVANVRIWTALRLVVSHEYGNGRAFTGCRVSQGLCSQLDTIQFVARLVGLKRHPNATLCCWQGESGAGVMTSAGGSDA